MFCFHVTISLVLLFMLGKEVNGLANIFTLQDGFCPPNGSFDNLENFAIKNVKEEIRVSPSQFQNSSYCIIPLKSSLFYIQSFTYQNTNCNVDVSLLRDQIHDPYSKNHGPPYTIYSTIRGAPRMSYTTLDDDKLFIKLKIIVAKPKIASNVIEGTEGEGEDLEESITTKSSLVSNNNYSEITVHEGPAAYNNLSFAPFSLPVQPRVKDKIMAVCPFEMRVTSLRKLEHCKYNDVVCTESLYCVDGNLFCDGVTNCPNGADEMYCDEDRQKIYQFIFEQGIFLFSATLILFSFALIGIWMYKKGIKSMYEYLLTTVRRSFYILPKPDLVSPARFESLMNFGRAKKDGIVCSPKPKICKGCVEFDKFLAQNRAVGLPTTKVSPFKRLISSGSVGHKECQRKYSCFSLENSRQRNSLPSTYSLIFPKDPSHNSLPKAPDEV